MFYAIINTDNDTVAMFDSMEDATTELAYYDDEHMAVDYYDYFYNVPASKVQSKVEVVRDYWNLDRAISLQYANQLSQLGMTLDDILK